MESVGVYAVKKKKRDTTTYSPCEAVGSIVYRLK